MRRLPLNDLVAFVSIAELRSFSRAAVRLQVSPSALSHTIRTLEERLGVRLLNRTTRSLSLTDVGARLEARLTPAFTSVDEALAELRDEADELSGRIRVTTMEYGAQLLMNNVVDFQRLHPGVEIELSINAALIDLAGNGFDAGVRLGEQVPQDMVALPIAPRTCLALAASTDYLARRGEPMVPADLLRHDCIRQRLASGTIYRWELEGDGHAVTIDPAGSLTSNSIAAIVGAAVAGAGICYVPDHHVRPHLEAGRLKRLLQSFSPSFEGHCLFYPRHRHQTRAFAAFLRHMRTMEG